MKRLSMHLPAIGLALALALSGAALSALTPIPAVTNTTPTTNATATTPTGAAHSSRQYVYYWYSYPGDSYNDYETLASEEWEESLYYWGDEVDTNPMGGTLIEEGYLDPNYPHDNYPSAYLYVHYTSWKLIPGVLQHPRISK